MNTLEYYMGLNYHIEISKLNQEDGGGYHVCIPQLGRYGFQADGATLQEALKELEEVKRLMFKELLEQDAKIPTPYDDNEYDEWADAFPPTGAVDFRDIKVDDLPF
jgi:predicted RNase H-like HicB family nuclease